MCLNRLLLSSLCESRRKTPALVTGRADAVPDFLRGQPKAHALEERGIVERIAQEGLAIWIPLVVKRHDDDQRALVRDSTLHEACAFIEFMVGQMLKNSAGVDGVKAGETGE